MARMNDTLTIRIPLLTLYTVGFVDSAGGRVPGHANKSRSANYRSRSAIVVVSQDDIDRIFIRKAWARHCTTDELCDEIFKTYSDFHPATIGIDSSARLARRARNSRSPKSPSAPTRTCASRRHSSPPRRPAASLLSLI